MDKSKVSIIMGVYNSEDTISEAIDSILEQTYKNWELIICDDASTDNTYNILAKYKQKFSDKMIILKNKNNSKLAYSLNRCLEVATGKYIARMDGDDISKKERLEKQVAFLKKHESVDLVGTGMQRFDKNNLRDIVWTEEHPDRYSMKNGTPFSHATILTYKYVYDALDGYTVSELTNRSQDRELWFRFFKSGFTGMNINEPLYLVRENEAAIKRRTPKVRFNSLRLTYQGYKLLDYPFHWYIRPTIKTIGKSLVPFNLQKLYRKIQSN